MPTPVAGEYSYILGTVVDYQAIPAAKVVAEPQFGVVGSVVKLDGRGSTDEEGATLTYEWEFVSTPIGSHVAVEGFRSIDPDGSVVSFSPDVVGEYVVGLKVSNGTFTSSQAKAATSIRAILVPHAQGLVPDGKFFWSYIRDVWAEVENREVFETLWSALIQIVGADLLKLYQVDFNKSIRDIQDLYQRRWLSYEPKLVLEADSLSMFLGLHAAGNDATTRQVGTEGRAVILSPDEVIVILGSRFQNVSGETLTITHSLDAGNVGEYALLGPNLTKTGFKLSPAADALSPTSDKLITGSSIHFSFQSTVWTYPVGTFNSVVVGDVIHYPTGPNAGFYRITEKTSTTVTVHKSPPSFSDATTSLTYQANVYRPVGYKVSQPVSDFIDTVFIPLSSAPDVGDLAAGRVIVVGGQTYKIIRTLEDSDQLVPFVALTVEPKVPANLVSLNWRTPHTLVSETQNFDELGVSAGDRLLVDVVQDGSETTVEVVAQVVGAQGDRLGFILTDEAPVAGEVPSIPNQTYVDLADGFGITQAVEGIDGTLTLAGMAQEMETEISSLRFQRTYLNSELTPESDIEVAGLTFSLRPRTVIRNSRIPVETELRSIPLLQEYIEQPSFFERDGSVFVVAKNGFEKEVPRKPVLLTENIDFVVDAELAYEGEMTFEPGSNVVSEQGDFIDRGIRPGDTFIVDAPSSLVGEYLIKSVDSAKQLTLVSAVPAYAESVVTADVRVERTKGGSFLRFSPGTFSAALPAPDRLWGEVSFFDNSSAIEDNFGILVGLKKEDLDSVSPAINYRQAVAGVMFALTKGSAMEKVRLGAQILLGLPFAEHRGVIRSIENDYRLNTSGDAILGRLLIEDVDASGNPEGILRVYTFPVDADSDLAGIDTNPETDEPYKVGDIVETFSALSKGVEITDYKTNPLTTGPVELVLQQFHSVKLRANDSIFSLKELALVSDFLKKITPAYVSFYVTSATEVADDIDIEDVVSMKFAHDPVALVDNASFSIPPALMFDSKNFNGISQIREYDGVLSIRRSGRDAETTFGSDDVTIVAGGVIDPRAAREEFEAPLMHAGDYLLFLSGPNTGLYEISTVVDDTTVTLAGAPAAGFATAEDQSYALLRKVSPTIFEGTAAVTNGNDSITLTHPDYVSLKTRGVSVGDWVVLSDGTDVARYLVAEVLESTSGVWDIITLDQNAGIPTGSYDCRIERPVLLTSNVETFEVTSTGVENITATDNVLNGLASIGDELHIDGVPYTIFDSVNLWVTPIIPAGTHDAVLVRKGRGETPITWDQSRFDPLDSVELSLTDPGGSASCTNGSSEVTLSSFNPRDQLLARPGDLLVLTSGTNSTVDVGYGPGVYPVVEVSSTILGLSVALGTTETVGWKLIRRAS
jgi:hypothetical protein